MEMEACPDNCATLALRVYGELKRRLNSGLLKPGAFIDQSALGEELGMSRAPLRDALIKLETEGFVSVLPRRGVKVRVLDLPTIRDVYEIIGALESATARSFQPSDKDLVNMKTLMAGMDETLGRDDFDAYYAANVAFHEAYLSVSTNTELRKQVTLLKERLYDFPRKRGFLKAWEVASMAEHREILARFEGGDSSGAADWIRDVHWSYRVQEPFIREYYPEAAG
ncbi:MAG: GntR family transcriptional regulator [Spirochaetota bacterium]